MLLTLLCSFFSPPFFVSIFSYARVTILRGNVRLGAVVGPVERPQGTDDGAESDTNTINRKVYARKAGAAAFASIDGASCEQPAAML